MRRSLLTAAIFLVSLPVGARAQTGQTAWTFTIPIQVSNALTRNVNVACVVTAVNSFGEQLKFGSGFVSVPLDERGSASTTVTVNVPNTSGNPNDATDYRCSLVFTQPDGTECMPQMGISGKSGICYAKEGTEFIPIVTGKVK